MMSVALFYIDLWVRDLFLEHKDWTVLSIQNQNREIFFFSISTLYVT